MQRIPLFKHQQIENKLNSVDENQSAPRLENRKTSQCSPRAPNLPHVLPSRMVGWHELCNPEFAYLSVFSGRVSDPVEFRNFFFVINSKFSSGPNKSKQTRILNTASL